ncbi:MAG: hypothetical protein PHF46_03420 [Candidatus Gracilibacteria bacterium]|nr:hypothetical protein [Candidatus Gracilibacteria bacterium]MDD3120430.1 hypothetical protein [Candidatus Gracilibacteria bacterium]
MAIQIHLKCPSSSTGLGIQVASMDCHVVPPRNDEQDYYGHYRSLS